MDRTHEIEEILAREDRAWGNSDIDLLMTLFHPDMVWVWPPHSRAYDPIDWILRMGKFDKERWSSMFRAFYDKTEVIHNRRVTKKIVISEQQDAAFAIVDVDILWGIKPGQDISNTVWSPDELNIKGRTCKTYVRVNGEWKMIAQPGAMTYPVEP